MKNNKRKVRYLILVLLLLFISIGYAYLNNTLNITGASTINNPTWDIHWENVVVKTGSISASTPTIDTSKTTVNYLVTFTIPGDYYEFTVDAVNAGTIDGMVSVISNKLNNVEITTLPNYLEYRVTYDDGASIESNHLLAANTSEKYKVHVEYKKNINQSDMPSTPETLNFSFSVTYVQSDNNAIKSVPDPVSFSTDSWPTIIRALRSENISAYNVGDTKSIDMGTFGIHTIRIANTTTPTECSTVGFSQTACGFVLEFTDIITNRRANQHDSSISANGNGNKGGWQYSEMRTFVNSDIYNAFPYELKNAIIDTTVVSGYGPRDSNNFETTDKIYLLDAREIYGSSYTSTANTAKDVERQLDYYASVGTSTSNYSAAKKNNSNWWLRSANLVNNTSFLIIASGGGWNSYNSSISNGISPAFRIR